MHPAMDAMGRSWEPSGFRETPGLSRAKTEAIQASAALNNSLTSSFAHESGPRAASSKCGPTLATRATTRASNHNTDLVSRLHVQSRQIPCLVVQLEDLNRDRHNPPHAHRATQAAQSVASLCGRLHPQRHR